MLRLKCCHLLLLDAQCARAVTRQSPRSTQKNNIDINVPSFWQQAIPNADKRSGNTLVALSGTMQLDRRVEGPHSPSLSGAFWWDYNVNQSREDHRIYLLWKQLNKISFIVPLRASDVNHYGLTLCTIWVSTDAIVNNPKPSESEECTVRQREHENVLAQTRFALEYSNEFSGPFRGALQGWRCQSVTSGLNPNLLGGLSWNSVLSPSSWNHFGKPLTCSSMSH